MSSRGAQAPRDPSLRSGRQKNRLRATAHPCLPEARKCRGTPHFVRDDALGCHHEVRKRRGTPRFARGDKKGSGRQKKARGDTWGLAQKHF
jgi:hypothetical protein